MAGKNSGFQPSLQLSPSRRFTTIPTRRAHPHPVTACHPLLVIPPRLLAGPRKSRSLFLSAFRILSQTMWSALRAPHLEVATSSGSQSVTGSSSSTSLSSSASNSAPNPPVIIWCVMFAWSRALSSMLRRLMRTFGNLRTFSSESGPRSPVRSASCPIASAHEERSSDPRNRHSSSAWAWNLWRGQKPATPTPSPPCWCGKAHRSPGGPECECREGPVLP